MPRQEKVFCSRCGCIHEITAHASINAAQEPELKAAAISGELFTWQCPQCGTVNLAKYPLLYHDPEAKLLLVLSEVPINADSCPEGYTGRLVGTVGELIEKIKIFDAGLDDIVIEMCKFVTLQDLGRDVELKFFKMDGPDSDLTFTFPENGQMQLLAVPLRTYQDCAGILQRNPAVRSGITGIARIAAAWLSQHIG